MSDFLVYSCNNLSCFDIFFIMRNFFCYMNIVKSKCIEYKYHICFCFFSILAGILFGIVYCSLNIDEDYEIILIKDNISRAVFNFCGIFFIVYMLIFFSIFNYYLNCLTLFSLVWLGYYFGKFLVYTFCFNLLHSLLSIVLFFNLTLFISVVFISFLVCRCRYHFFCKSVNWCDIKSVLIYMTVCFFCFTVVAGILFASFGNFTGAIILI